MTDFNVVTGKLGLRQRLWTKLACGFIVVVADGADGAAKVVEDENPDDAAMEKTGIAVTLLVIELVPLP